MPCCDVRPRAPCTFIYVLKHGHWLSRKRIMRTDERCEKEERPAIRKPRENSTFALAVRSYIFFFLFFLLFLPTSPLPRDTLHRRRRSRSHPNSNLHAPYSCTPFIHTPPPTHGCIHVYVYIIHLFLYFIYIHVNSRTTTDSDDAHPILRGGRPSHVSRSLLPSRAVYTSLYKVRECILYT